MNYYKLGGEKKRSLEYKKSNLEYRSSKSTFMLHEITSNN